jgi:hypothetical protein
MKKTIVILTIALTAAACGGSDSEALDSSEPSASESTDTAPAAGDDDSSTQTTAAPAEVDADAEPDVATPEPAEQPPVGENGSFTINGFEFTVNSLNRCMPFFDQPGDIDLQTIAQGGLLNLAVVSGMLDVSVQGSTVKQMFGSISFGSDFLAEDFEVSDDRMTGSATLVDALGSGETVEASWDVKVPSEIRDCSL